MDDYKKLEVCFRNMFCFRFYLESPGQKTKLICNVMLHVKRHVFLRLIF